METQAFIESVEYQTKRLCDKLAELDAGRRKVIVDGEDVTAAEADELRHRVTENLTIISRLRANMTGIPAETAAARRSGPFPHRSMNGPTP